MARSRKPPPPDGPRQRYADYLRRGIASGDAARLVAESYGIATSEDRIKPDGTPVVHQFRWDIKNIERLLGMKYEFIHGLGGPLDGAAKYPQYVDGFVEPP